VLMFGVQTNIARKNSTVVHLAAFMIILFPAASPVFLGLANLPRPVASTVESTVEPEQLKQRVQERYMELYGELDRFLKPETKQELLAMIRGWLSPRSKSPPANLYIPWTCAAILTLAGVAAFLDARRRWLTLELG
jgi:hypothetical protein